MAEKFDSLGIRAIFMEFSSSDPAENTANLNALNLGTAAAGTPIVSGGLENRSGLRR